MIQVMFTLIVTITMLLSSGGATYAVQNSIPGDIAYPAKALGEQIQLSLATQSQNRLELLQKLVDRRIEEMALLKYQKQPIPASIALQLNTQMDEMLRLAAGLQEQEMQQALTRIMTRARVHEMIMEQFSSQGDAVVNQVHSRLQEQIRLANMGLTNPQAFRETIRQRSQNRNGQSSATSTSVPDPTNTSGSNGKGPNSTPQPQGNGSPSGTDTPGNGGPANTEPGKPDRGSSNRNRAGKP
jgi:hypothetical protein